MSCIVCDASLDAAVRAGEPMRAATPEEIVRDRAGAVSDAFCGRCKSRGRLRALAAHLACETPERLPEARVLLVSASPQERAVYARHFGCLEHVSLYGDFADPTCRTGVDLTRDDLGGPFDRILALGVMDFIPEPALALRRAAAALAPGGAFLFYIMPYRLAEMAQPVRVVNYKGLHGAGYMKPDEKGETGVPNCRFDPRAIPGWIVEAGLVAGTVVERDPLSGLDLTFHAATRPAT